MLQTSNALSVPTAESAEAEFVSATKTFDFIVGYIRRQYHVILFFAVLALALGAVYVIATPASFTAQTSLLIDARKIQLFQQQPILGDFSVDSAWVESQVEALKSENVSLAVIKELHLMENPEFAGPHSSWLGALFGIASDAKDQPQGNLTRSVISALQDNLSVKRVGLSYVIEIRYRSSNPERAAQIANAIAEAYINDQLESKYDTARRASEWLQTRLTELSEKATVADAAVVAFKSKNNIVESGGRLMNEQRVAELNSQLVIARTTTSNALAQLTRTEAVLRSDAPNATVDSTVADSLKNEVITKLRSEYLALANREADWSVRYGRNHLATVNLRNQMREIRVSIINELRRIAESYKSDYEIAKQREASIKAELDAAVTQSQATDKAQVTLRELESTAQSYTTLRDNFLQRYMETIQQQSFPITEARVISKATPPERKSHPKTTLILAFAAFGGMILGMGAGMLRELSDRVFRTTEQVESLLGTDCIAVVPLLKKGKQSLPAPKKAAGPVAPRTIKRSRAALWSIIDAPISHFAEAIRSIKLAIDLRGMINPNKVIGFTSSLPNEGKSTLAASVAQLISQTGACAILVDCDIRNPSLSRALAPSAEVGLVHVISGSVPLEKAVWKDESTGMTFLPMATRSRFVHSNEILAADMTKRFFEKLRAEYDYVIIDLSPLAPVVDVRSTANFVDSYVFVVEWGRTRIDVARHVFGTARGIYENLLGTVMNKTDINLLQRYSSYFSTYYGNKYFKRYGYAE
jgi:succinoglycan biosynthesis transport protein ExoP